MLNLNINNSLNSLPFYTPIFRIYKDTITQSANMPEVRPDGSDNFVVYCSYYDGGTQGRSYQTNPLIGQTSNDDFDQYAIYFAVTYGKVPAWKALRISNLGQVNYFSMNWESSNVGYYNSTPNNFVTCVRQVVTQTPAPTDPPYSFTYAYMDGTKKVPNPFQKYNYMTSCFPSVATTNSAKVALASTKNTRLTDAEFNKSLTASLFSLTTRSGTPLGVYRPYKEASTPWDDCFITNQCAPTYLAIPMDSAQAQALKYGIVKIKIPNVYDTTECQIFSEYDVMYYSMSCVLNSDNPNVENLVLPFWTINGRMFNKIKTSDGHVFVVWAPHDVVVERKANPQPTDIVTEDYEPPIVMTKDGHPAYLMQQSDHYYSFRFQEANPSWAGNPINAPCYKDETTSQPITDQLGDWCPQVQGSENTAYF